MSDTKTPTATATETAFDLTPPDPVPEVKPEKAAGLVPVSEEVKSKLQTKVDGFVADLIAEDANSPEFGKKVDQLTNMGRKEIMAAAGMSNRFLDRPVRAMDKDEGVGANLAELRRVVEDLDPGKRGKLSGPRKILGIIPFGNKLTNYFQNVHHKRPIKIAFFCADAVLDIFPLMKVNQELEEDAETEAFCITFLGIFADKYTMVQAPKKTALRLWCMHKGRKVITATVDLPADELEWFELAWDAKALAR